jgi:hypothetical protein
VYLIEIAFHGNVDIVLFAYRRSDMRGCACHQENERPLQASNNPALYAGGLLL